MSTADRIGRVHVLTDECIQSRYSHSELAVLAARGGAHRVQYREKRLISREICTMTLVEIQRSLSGYDTRLIVDDRVQEAFDARAFGVHLGPDDMPASEARKLLGPDAVIGVTANNLEAAQSLADEPVDYLGVGPVFRTGSKENPAPPLGLTGLRRIASAVTLPIVAIGGIHAGNAAAVLAAGAFGVAVLSAVACAADPENATRAIVEAVAGEVTHDG